MKPASAREFKSSISKFFCSSDGGICGIHASFCMFEGEVAFTSWLVSLKKGKIGLSDFTIFVNLIIAVS